jgi:hypothetical protein
MLMNKPLKNVEKGVLTVAPGAKIPTTRDPNVILELSKKNQILRWIYLLISSRISLLRQIQVVKPQAVTKLCLLGCYVYLCFTQG